MVLGIGLTHWCSRLLFKSPIVSNFPASCSLLQALFDNGDLFARETVKGIDKLVDLGLLLSNSRSKTRPWNLVQSQLVCGAGTFFPRPHSTRLLPGKAGIGLRYFGVPRLGPRSYMLPINCSILSPETQISRPGPEVYPVWLRLLGSSAERIIFNFRRRAIAPASGDSRGVSFVNGRLFSAS